jgi:hypothetical protein
MTAGQRRQSSSMQQLAGSSSSGWAGRWAAAAMMRVGRQRRYCVLNAGVRVSCRCEWLKMKTGTWDRVSLFTTAYIGP